MFHSVVNLRSIKMTVTRPLLMCFFAKIIITTTKATVLEWEETKYSDTFYYPQTCSGIVSGDSAANGTCGVPIDNNNIPENTIHCRYKCDSLLYQSSYQFKHWWPLRTLKTTPARSYSNAVASSHESHLPNDELFHDVSDLSENGTSLLLFGIKTQGLKRLNNLDQIAVSHTIIPTRKHMTDISNRKFSFHPWFKTRHVQNLYYNKRNNHQNLHVSTETFKRRNIKKIGALGIPMDGMIFITPGMIFITPFISRYSPHLKPLRRAINVFRYSKRGGLYCSLRDNFPHGSLERIERGHQPFEDYTHRFKRFQLDQNSLGELYDCFRNINTSTGCSPDMTRDIDRCFCDAIPTHCHSNAYDAMKPQDTPAIIRWLRFSFLNQYLVTIPTRHLKHVDPPDALIIRNPRVATRVKELYDILVLNFHKDNFLEIIRIFAMQICWVSNDKGLKNLQYLDFQNDNVDLRKLEEYRNLRELYVGEWLKDLRNLQLGMNETSGGLRAIGSYFYQGFVPKSRSHSVDVHWTSPKLKHYSSLRNNITTSLSQLVKEQNLTLELNGVPINCGYNNFHFIELFNTTNAALSQHQIMTCTHPTLGSVPVMDYSSSSSHRVSTSSNASVIACPISGTLIVVLLVAGVIIIRRKKLIIRYYVHAARQSFRRRFGNGHEPLDDNYVYDAFVVYSAQDCFFVHNDLMKCLENDHGMHLCIHYRDFIPGRDIEDTIIEALKKSRKAIVVLSPSFLQSNWCHFEFKMARQIDIEEDRDMVLLVILKPISGCSISRTLTAMLQKRTYLCWTNNPEGQNLFWS